MKPAYTKSKETYHHGDLYRALMEETLVLIREKGVDGFSLREVANRVGVSHMAPYHHFADKNALLQAVARRGCALLSREMSKAYDEASDRSCDKLRAVSRAYARFSADNPEYFQTLSAPEIMAKPLKDARFSPDEQTSLTAADTGNPFDDTGLMEVWFLQQRSVEGCMKSGELKAGDPLIETIAVWSMVHGACELWRLQCFTFFPEVKGSVEDLVDKLIDSILLK